MGNNPQQSELRRSAKGANVQDSAAAKADTAGGPGREDEHPTGQDKGDKGGGRTGGTPPEQRPDHP
ncbi:hypothetical protein ACFY00_15400 [Kitasatospora sp. NPDC001540]|uniref:hypothetical protein n=1 Tax=Kitasatospora sp. NPDC001540 TaxID=3364014 RepID=UPI0036CEDE0E